jgi:hypothetical protein
MMITRFTCEILRPIPVGELTVHLHREPVAEWICLDAQTTLSHGGTGIATSVLSDLDGPIGVGAQALLIAQRPVRQPQPA